MNIILFILLTFHQEAPSNIGEIILRDNTVHMNIGQQTYVLEDEDGIYSIEDVTQSNYQSRFVQSNQYILTFPPNDSYYWIKFNIRSTTDKSFIIFIDEAKFKKIDLYYKVGDYSTWKILRNGFSLPQDQRIIAHNFQLFPIDLSKDTQGEFYLRLQPQLLSLPISVKFIPSTEE